MLLQHDFIFIRIEPDAGLGDEIGHDHVAVFRFQFAAGFGDQVFGFGGKADEEAVAFFAAQLGEDVDGRVEPMDMRAAVFFTLYWGASAR